jgi:hypothetical protein
MPLFARCLPYAFARQWFATLLVFVLNHVEDVLPFALSLGWRAADSVAALQGPHIGHKTAVVFPITDY